VIAITGYATIEHALESFQAGAFDFLPKPFDVDELITVVERALRYHDRRQRPAPETRATSAGPDEVLSLGRHSWARLDTDGTAVLGVGETLAGVTGPLESIEWSSTDGQTVQGATCALLIDENGQKHRVRAPLSGDILTTNSTLEVEPNRLASEPSSDGWLLRIIPDNLEQEASRLHRRQRVGDD
jgi:glycine cleavage system H lipoate-binding protein